MNDAQIDPIALEVLWNRLISIVDEQAAVLMHASFTTVVREAGDLSAGVFDAEGNMLAQAVTGTPATSIPWPIASATLSAPIRSLPSSPATAC